MNQVTPPDNFVNSSGLKDNALVQAVNKQPWDPSVKAFCVFPTVLDQMAKNLAWTSALATLFMTSRPMRWVDPKAAQQAQAAGNLKTTRPQTVTTQNQGGQQIIVIQPGEPASGFNNGCCGGQYQ